MFENMHDLQYYYTNGYRSKSTMISGKPMLKDIFEFLKYFKFLYLTS